MDNRLSLRAALTVCINVAHNIVTNFFFSGFRHLKVHDILIFHHLINLFLRDVQSQFLLGLCQSNPQFMPCGEFLLLGENVLHLLAGIS